MALSIGDNFSYLGAKPLDARLKYTTVADMKTVADSTMYDGCLAYCVGTDKTYQWKSANSVDATTGKWREFSSGGGGGGSTAGSIYNGTLTASNWGSNNKQTVTFTGYNADFNGVVGVPSTATTAQLEEYANAVISVDSQSGATITFVAETLPTIDLPVSIYCGGGGSGGSGVPDGGTTGQALIKKSNTDGDVEWSTINSIPTGGTKGQVLAKKTNTDRDVEWKDDSAGHTILDTDATAMTQREKLQFTGLDVADDSTNNKTEVKPLGLNSDDLDEIIDTSEISNGYIQNGFNYSLEEQVVGKWIDGKPLYQKTIQSILPDYSLYSYVDTGVSISFGKIVSIEIIATNGWIQSMPTARKKSDGNIYYLRSALSVNSSSANKNTVFIENWFGDDTCDGATVYITIQYTKTTD